MTDMYRVAGTLIVLSGLAFGTSSCLGPKYGTDTPASAQLLTDLGNAATLTTPKKTALAYQPRGALVKPTDTSLPEPEKSLASKDNPQWVESPEETRQRLKAEADENADKPFYRSPLSTSESKTAQQLQAYRDARRLQDGRYTDRRRFISDPPLDYRKVEDPSKLTDLGESELEKEKRRKKQAEIAGTGQHWWEVWK